jgi:hypothetical protein
MNKTKEIDFKDLEKRFVAASALFGTGTLFAIVPISVHDILATPFSWIDYACFAVGAGLIIASVIRFRKH